VVDIGYEPKRDRKTGEPVLDGDGQPVMQRRQLTVTKDTKREAQAELARIENARATGTYIAPSDLTVGQWIEEWLARKAEDLEVTTINSYRETLRHAQSQLGHVRLQELTEEQVEAWVAWLLTSGRVRGSRAGTGLSTTTVDMALGRLKEVLARAVTKRLVHLNAAANVTVPRRARKQERKTKIVIAPWAADEVRVFVAGVLEERMYAPMLLSLMGLRPAEVCGLRWSDIDVEARTLWVANTRTLMNNSIVVEKDTKSEAGDRGLPLPAPLYEALKRFRAQQAREKLALGADYVDSGYVTVDAAGEVLRVRELRKEAYRLMAKLGLRQVRLYDARSSCLTYLANNGVPDHILARWAGHASVKTTKKWYVKPTTEDLREAATTWEGLHGSAALVREIL
jgi:integrase